MFVSQTTCTYREMIVKTLCYTFQMTFSLLSMSSWLKLPKEIALAAKDFGFVDFMMTV